MEMQPYQPPQSGIQFHQIRGLTHLIYYMAVHFDALETLVRAHCSEEEYRQAHERARQGFPSDAVFPDVGFREYLQYALRTSPTPQDHPN
jgi:hypothetical protein